MQGLMQSYPLTLVHPFERAERLFADKPIVIGHARPGSSGRPTGEWAERTRRLGGVLDALGISADGRVGHVRVELRAPPRAVLRRAVHRAACCTRSTSGSSPSSCSSSPTTREDEVIFADRSLLKLLWPLIDELPARQARRRDGRRRRGRDPRRRRGSATTRRCWPTPTRSSSTSTTRTAPRPCVTRAAPPATRRASSTRTARRVLHCMSSMFADTLARLRGRRDPAGRPDVPRQRVGARAGRRAGRLDVRDARPRPLAEGDRRR